MAVRPELVGDKQPHSAVKHVFNSIVVSHTGTAEAIKSNAGGDGSAGEVVDLNQSVNQKNSNDIHVCYVLPLKELNGSSGDNEGAGSLASNSLDPAEIATNIYEKLKLRLNTPLKGTGLKLSHLESMLLQRLRVANGEFGARPEESETRLRENMSKAAFRDAQWFPCLEACE